MIRIAMTCFMAASLLLSDPGIAQTISLEEPFEILENSSIQKTVDRLLDTSGGKRCMAAGRRVMIGKDGANDGWLVTTAQACGWAASAAVVLIFSQTKEGPVLVLEDRAISIIVRGDLGE